MRRLDLGGVPEHGGIGLVVAHPRLELFDLQHGLTQHRAGLVAFVDGLLGPIDEIGAEIGHIRQLGAPAFLLTEFADGGQRIEAALQPIAARA